MIEFLREKYQISAFNNYTASNNNYNIMEIKKYNNALACRKYYEKNKGNHEFRLRKAYQARTLYIIKNDTRYSGIFFKLGNNYFLKQLYP